MKRPAKSIPKPVPLLAEESVAAGSGSHSRCHPRGERPIDFTMVGSPSVSKDQERHEHGQSPRYDAV